MRKRSQPARHRLPSRRSSSDGLRSVKATIAVDVRQGTSSVPEAARRYGFTQSEFREWTKEHHRAGVDALKVNKKAWKPSTVPR
jgi:transposase-like protein